MKLFLLIVSMFFLLLAAFEVDLTPQVNLGWLGLFFFAASFLPFPNGPTQNG